MAKRQGDYDKYREGQAAISRERSAAGRDIGPIPAVVNADRRNRGLDDPVHFYRAYFPNRFFLPFGEPHIQAIHTINVCMTEGGLFAIEFMRGGGKSNITEVGIIRAICYGLRRYPVFFGATDQLAQDSLQNIYSEFSMNEQLAEDFPEICFPIRALERITQRARGQTCEGESTNMVITANKLVLPTIKGSPSSGAVIEAHGLTGAFKGMKHITAQGHSIRPDVIVLDDCQTTESAKSPSQTADRERIISNDVLGLAGPTTKMAGVFLCTPIFSNDLSERFVNREKHPEWQGRRFPMVIQMPTNLDKWDEYGEVVRESLQSDNRGLRGNDFYRENQAILDEGAVLSWPDRKEDGDVSAVQTAMNLYLLSPSRFFPEFQLQTETAKQGANIKEFSAEAVAARVSGYDRMIVPQSCSRITSFIDLGGELLWYAVCAWNERFGGSVIDYGCFPQQGRSVFAATDPRPGLSRLYPDMTEKERVFAALEAFAPSVLGREYFRPDGSSLRIGRGLIDAGWLSDVVVQYLLRSQYSGIVYPSKGVGRSATQVGIARWAMRAGERKGHHWRLTITQEKRQQLFQFDPDTWKSFVHSAMTVPLGGPTALTLFGKSPGPHAMIGEHIASEYGEEKELRGDRFHKWQMMPNRTDNHLLDCVVGCAAAASFDGLEISVGVPVVLHNQGQAKSKRRSFREEYQAKRKAAV
jgi:hypothetical protein